MTLTTLHVEGLIFYKIKKLDDVAVSFVSHTFQPDNLIYYLFNKLKDVIFCDYGKANRKIVNKHMLDCFISELLVV